MDLKGFWIKCVWLGLGGFILTSLVSAGSMALFHSKNLNQVRLKEMKQESQMTQNQFEDEIRYLVSDLINLQTDKDSSQGFSIHGVLSKQTQKIVSIYPKKLPQNLKSKLDKFTKIENLKRFPVTFRSIKLGKSNVRQIVLLVDPSQVKNPKLSTATIQSGILFGVISHKKVKQMAHLLVAGGFSEAFIFDAQKGWWPLHSKVSYSGYSLPKRSIFYQLVQKSRNGWLTQLNSENILTTGVRLTFANSYLVLNRKLAVPQDYFMSSLKTVVPFIFGVSVFLSILFILFIQPIAKAYEHLSLILRSYALSKEFPLPQSKKNAYVMQTLPWIKKIYWDLRSHQMVEAINQDGKLEKFSQMIQKLSREIEEQYSEIKVKFKCIEDASLSTNLGSGEDLTQILWLKQAFSELIKNAVECINQKGLIHICTLRKNGVFCCTVRNYNKGDIDRVCQPYYSAKKGGNGLGVTLALSTVSQMGGEIQFLNKPLGLEIEVSLPLRKVKTIGQARLQI